MTGRREKPATRSIPNDSNSPCRVSSGCAAHSINGLFPQREHAKSGHEGHCPNTLVGFWSKHPEAKVALERWYRLVKAAHWASTDDVQKAAPKSKVLNRERVRFEVAGGKYRLVAAFDFRRQVAFVKFVGTHAEYDRIDALTVSQHKGSN